MKINIQESLKERDAITENRYNLYNTYTANNYTAEQKKKIAEAIYKGATDTELLEMLDDSEVEYREVQEYAKANSNRRFRDEDGNIFSIWDLLNDFIDWELDDKVEEEPYKSVKQLFIDYIRNSTDKNGTLEEIKENLEFEESISSNEPVVKFQGKSFHTFTKDKKWEVDFDESGNILARTRHGKPFYFKGHINDEINDFPSTDEDNIILAAREQYELKFGNKAKRNKLTEESAFTEASYGGAFDIEDDQYFTKEDLMEFAEEVMDVLRTNARGPLATPDYTDLYIDGNQIFITVTDEDGNEFTDKVSVDFRRVKKPSDLISKYTLPFAERIIAQAEDFYRSMYEGCNKKKKKLIKEDIDKNYAFYLNLIDTDVEDMLKEYHEAGNKSPSEILIERGYTDTDSEIMYKEVKDDNHTYRLVIDFEPVWEDNTIHYYVLKDGKIPAGYTYTKTFFDKEEIEEENENINSGAVDINQFTFKNYLNPDGQNHPKCKTYRSTLEYMASETERLFNNALHTYSGEMEPYKQLTISYMGLNRHSCIRDLVDSRAEQGLKDAQSAIFKRQHELLELSKQFNKWNGKEWVKSSMSEEFVNKPKSLEEANKIAVGNEKYKGYMIRQDHKYGGYNVYDKDNEMEDSGFKSIEQAKEFIDSLNESKSLKESSYDEANDDDPDDIQTYFYDDDSWEDAGVSARKDFEAEGQEFTWVRRHGDVEHLDFDNWAVWEAHCYDDAETYYFIVDEDTGFIDWGPVDTLEEAQEFLASKVSDWEDLDESCKSNTIKSKLTESVLDINQGDLVDFGPYGKLYVCNPNYQDDYYWVTDEEESRMNKHASGWSIEKDLAERVIESAFDDED